MMYFLNLYDTVRTINMIRYDTAGSRMPKTGGEEVLFFCPLPPLPVHAHAPFCRAIVALIRSKALESL